MYKTCTEDVQNINRSSGLQFRITVVDPGILFCLLFLMFFSCPYMAINVNVQYNGGFLPDIILLTQLNITHI